MTRVVTRELAFMAGHKSADSPVRIIGSRELHQNLPAILNELQNPDVRYVLTVHGKPRAVMIGARPFLDLVNDRDHPSEALVGLQLSALLGNDLIEVPIEHLERALDGGRKAAAERNGKPEKP